MTEDKDKKAKDMLIEGLVNKLIETLGVIAERTERMTKAEEQKADALTDIARHLQPQKATSAHEDHRSSVVKYAEGWKYYQKMLDAWQLLDDIDTLSDSMKPQRNVYYDAVMRLVKKRFDIYNPDETVTKPQTKRFIIGTVAVDSGTLSIIDPCYIEEYVSEMLSDFLKNDNIYDQLYAGEVPLAMVFGGFGGDGSYPVWATAREDGLITKVEIDFQNTQRGLAIKVEPEVEEARRIADQMRGKKKAPDPDAIKKPENPL